MRRLLLIVVIGFVGVGLPAARAQHVPDAEKLFAAGQHKEVTNGDLKGATAIYRQVVAAAGTNRSLAARALFRIAECQRKLGDAEARRSYEQIVREYGDRPEAAAARAQLGPTSAQTDVQHRRLTLPDNWNYAAGPVSADGRYLPYIDSDYNLALRDLVGGTNRVLIRPASQRTGFPATGVVSRDNRQIAFSWCYEAGTAMTRVCELRTMALDQPGVEPRTLAGDIENFLLPLDWTPDGTAIAVRMRQATAGRLGLVDARTGVVRPLKSVDWRFDSNVYISPDGLHIAFDLPVDDASPARDVFVLALDLSREVHAVAHPANDELAGWSPDGRYLIFTSNRRGSRDLLALRWANGAPQGEPELLQPDLAGRSLGLSTSGALITDQFISDRSIQLVSIDLASGRGVEPPARVMPIGTSQNPAWSPDGRQLAYTTVRDGRRVIGIRTMETGATRHVDAQALASMQGLTWAPDGRSFVVSGAIPTGRYGIYTIDAQSGAIAPLVVPISSDDQLSYEGFFWSPDGRRLYYHSQNGKIHERDNVSGDAREVTRGEYGPISLSPDGRWIATERRSSTDTPASLVLVSPATGEVREILRLAPGQSINNVAMPWAADSRSVLVRKMLSATGERSELWVVPIDGSSPRLVDFDANRIVAFAVGKIRLHPDGRQLAFVGGTSRVEVWALENFLPPSR